MVKTAGQGRKQEEKKEPEKSEESEAKPSPDDPSKHHERISVLEKCVSQMAKEIADDLLAAFEQFNAIAAGLEA